MITIEGAGIAGRVLHCELSRAGIGSELKDRSAFPREKVCGGVLQWDSWKYLSERFRLNVPVRVIDRIEHYWRGKKAGEMQLSPPAVYVPRFLLDHSLDSVNAGRPGPLLRVNASGASREDGGWIGFQARIVSPVSALQMHYGKGICLGISPTLENSAHAAFVVKRGSFRSSADLERLIFEELGIRIPGPFKGTSRIFYGSSHEPFAIGDAKMTTFPFLGFGMKHAVESARLLGRCIRQGDTKRYPALHRRIFRRQRLAGALITRLYDSPLRGALKPIITNPSLFESLYRWVHAMPMVK